MNRTFDTINPYHLDEYSEISTCKDLKIIPSAIKNLTNLESM